jgi:hypothetical protein
VGIIKMSTPPKQPEKPRTTFALTLIVIIGILSLIFLSLGLTDLANAPPTYESVSLLVLGLLGIFFVIFTLSKFMTHLNIQPSRSVLTLLQCAKCSFKSVRNFQLGDYIPRTMGTCPSCGGNFVIEAIYAEDRVKKKKEEFA